jgi:hypothetical protein
MMKDNESITNVSIQFSILWGEAMRQNFVEVKDGVKLWTDVSGERNELPIMFCNGGPGCADYLEPSLKWLMISLK